jgi:hypothetical protein
MKTSINGLKLNVGRLRRVQDCNPRGHYRWPDMSIAFQTLLACMFFICAISAADAWAATRYVSKSGSDLGNTCTDASSPCLTIGRGISQMSGGEKLIVGDGTYNERINNTIPAGSSGQRTKVLAQNTGGVTLVNPSTTETDPVVSISNNYIDIDGFRIDGNAHAGSVFRVTGDYVKVFRCAAFNAANSNNGAGFVAGSGADYVLFEECWAWGLGARYKFQVYHANHVIVRRCVARLDYKSDGSLQCANFNNYDSVNTIFQNNIAIIFFSVVAPQPFTDI